MALSRFEYKAVKNALNALEQVNGLSNTAGEWIAFHRLNPKIEHLVIKVEELKEAADEALTEAGNLLGLDG